MKLWLLLLFLGLGLCGYAQEVEYEGVKYEVKEKAIFQDGKDVTSTLSAEKQQEIMAIHEKTKMTALEAEKAVQVAEKEQKEAEKAAQKLEKERKEAEKAIKKAEKAQKLAEKEQRRAEKELKRKQHAQDDFEKATKRLQQNQDKYERLKHKGKLSPNDEEKWLKRIEGYREDLDKAKRTLSKT